MTELVRAPGSRPSGRAEAAATAIGDPGTRPGLREVVAVWALWAVVTAEVFATYSRLPAHELYHVSDSGPDAGAGRALVLANFPLGLVAIAIVPIVAARWLATAPTPRVRRTVVAVSVVSVLLCAATAWPGVVDQSDLDARPVNAIAAAGVALAAVLTAVTVRKTGLGAPAAVAGDRARAAIAAVLLVASLPWLASDLGFLIGRLPPFGHLFESHELWAPLGDATLHPAVHVGHHHGVDGTLLALTALLLSRTLRGLRPRLRTALSLYLALMFVYGVANATQDFWYEQLVKRGILTWSLPGMLVPSPNVPWLVLLVLAAAVYPVVRVAARRPARPARPPRRPVALTAAVVVAAEAIAALVAVGVTHDGGAAHASTPEPRAGSGEGRIAFAMAPGARSDVFVMRADGSGLRSVAADPASDVAPSWSPDGRAIVFQSTRDGNNDLYAVDTDGRRLRRLTDDGAADGEPAWSPDGREIAFVSERDGNAEVYVMPAGGGAARRVTTADGVDEWPSWSPDGRWIAFDSDRGGDFDVYAVSRDGKRLRRLVNGEGDDRYAAWSPDGRRLAFESDRDGNYELYVLTLGGGTRRVTTNTVDDFAPAWSPNGRKLVFESERDGNVQIYSMGADGAAVRRLTTGQADKSVPRWQPRGR